YHVTKRAMAVTGEALECLGGNGYVEESVLPRLYREAPVNSVWEGSGNVNALDLLRALTREEGVLDALVAELSAARGAAPAFDTAVADLESILRRAQRQPETAEPRARHLAERVAVCLQASLLLRYSANDVADSFVRTRIEGSAWTFGAAAR
ncbi:MAG: acyl-CoA dehydrogenase family protein, partial [Candidatus Nanopelagicales bacterium]